MKNIVLFGAGRSATCLIDYILANAPKQKWHLSIIDYDLMLIRSKIGKSYYATADAFDVRVASDARHTYIQKADIVISLLPPHLHSIIAKDCLRFKKPMLTASYLDDEARKMEKDIEKAGILFMYEMGIDPGIDHMSAIKIINSIERKGGIIHSFRSYCGGIIAPEYDDNPWHYKIAWNPHNIIMAGSEGATYKEKGKIKQLSYHEVFDAGNKAVQVPGMGKLAAYPNRDSLSYMELYHLTETDTFMRATLRLPDFCEGWNALVKLGLTDDKEKVSTDHLSYRKWVSQHVKADRKKSVEENLAAFLGVRENSKVMRQLKYLGLLSSDLINKGEKTNAAILQGILEDKLKMNPSDKDIVVMLHEVEFERRNIITTMQSYMIIYGDDNLRTAIAKTVGYPLGILTKLILTGKITLKGLHIPVIPEIYNPVLKELEENGIRFEESFS